MGRHKKVCAKANYGGRVTEHPDNRVLRRNQRSQKTETVWPMRMKRIKMLYENLHFAWGQQLFLGNRSYVNEFFCTAALQPKFQLSSLTTYYIPEDQDRGWQRTCWEHSFPHHVPILSALHFILGLEGKYSPRHPCLWIFDCEYLISSTSVIDCHWSCQICSKLALYKFIQFQRYFHGFSVVHGFSSWRMAASRAIVSTSRDSH